MAFRRQLIFLAVAILSLLVLADALLIPPGQHWFDQVKEESRSVAPRSSIAPGDDYAAIRRAAQAQWDLAEWHFVRGEWDDAEREYRRLMSDFPYIELDYGYRTDDARYRLDEVARLRRGEKVVPREAGPRR